jgi:hypothetical protein
MRKFLDRDAFTATVKAVLLTFFLTAAVIGLYRPRDILSYSLINIPLRIMPRGKLRPYYLTAKSLFLKN